MSYISKILNVTVGDTEYHQFIRIAYHQTEADKKLEFMHGYAVMICKGSALDDIPNLR